MLFHLGDKVLINTSDTDYFMYQGMITGLDDKVHYVLDNSLSGTSTYPTGSKCSIYGFSTSGKRIPYRMTLQTAYLWLNKNKWYNEIFDSNCMHTIKQSLKINKILAQALIDYKKYDIMYYENPTISQAVQVLSAIAKYINGTVETVCGKHYVKKGYRWLSIQNKCFVTFDSVLGMPVAKATLPLYEIDDAIKYIKGM